MSAYARDAYFPEALPAPAEGWAPNPQERQERQERPARQDESGPGDWVDRDPSWGAQWKVSPLAAPIWDRVLLDPIRDILRRPGKAFRANLVNATFALVDERRRPPTALAAALEILHAGSLIVDDIVDESLERRGGPSVHRIYGVPRALNAGNYMYFWALELLAELELPARDGIALQRRTNRTLLDCHRGQALDVGLWIGSVPQADISAASAEISTLKTGALMSLAAFAGVIAAGGQHAQLLAAGFGMRIGVVLQKLDDLGNLTSKHSPGKRFEDLRWGRVTWPWAWAAETLDPGPFAELEARSVQIQRGHALQTKRATATATATVTATVTAAPTDSSEIEARTSPTSLASAATTSAATSDNQVAELAGDLLMCAGLHRRGELRAELAWILSDLKSEFGDKPAVRAIASEMKRLEESYE